MQNVYCTREGRLIVNAGANVWKAKEVQCHIEGSEYLIRSENSLRQPYIAACRSAIFRMNFIIFLFVFCVR